MLDILYGKQVIVVYDYREDCTYSFSDIPLTITCLYAYFFETEQNPNLRYLQPDNARTNLPKLVLKGYHIEDKLPLFVFFSIRPYDAINFGHAIGVDVEVFYRWDELTAEKTEELPLGATIKILHLVMVQEPRPIMQPWVPDDFLFCWTWGCFGEILLDRDHQEKNRLDFKVNAYEFLKACPPGRLKNRLSVGLGIRASTVYSNVPAQNLTGLQVKLNIVDEHNQKLIIDLGQFLDFNQDYCDKHVQVFYRWRGGLLELGIRTCTVD
ncbi:hypothetical protein BVRB_5g114980 [Beta vulgaris subsp. vulgaris]|nr:hypothetical protein BVRB_5g114980 [Beta vulgaris subsp. vulgaris]